MKLVKILAAQIALSMAAFGLSAQSSQELRFDPPEWKYGMITKGESASASVKVENLTKKDIKVEFVPTCSCLSVSPSTASLKGGASARFDLAYDSTDDEGKVTRYFIVKTDPPSEKPIFFILNGVVRADNGASAASGAAAAAAKTGGARGSSLVLRYYYAPGCRSCETFLSSGLPVLEARYGVAAAVERRDILDPSAYEELAAFASSIGDTIRASPALRVGSLLLQGDEEIEARLPGILAAGPAVAPDAAPGAIEAAHAEDGPAPVRASAFAVIAAGLVDGINPCAFTTLLFLLSSLALAGRGRREVLAIGLVFSLGVFLTYLGAGLGLFAALRAASAAPVVSAVLRWALVAVLAVLAALSLVDYAKIRAGKSSEMLLQLPDSLKLRIHSSIRTRARAAHAGAVRADHSSAARTAAIALSSLALGFLVSIFEFACTGQVYLPTLAYLARGPGGSRAVILLVLYNLCFILPLLAVFGAAYFGVSSKRITSLFQRRMGAAKIALAAVFAALALLTALT
jgi:cytochrome c biogenesis protein CcdA